MNTTQPDRNRAQVCDQYCSASSLLGAQQRFPSPSPPQKRRRGPGRGGRLLSLSPLSSSLPVRSSRGEREKRPLRFSCRTLLVCDLQQPGLRPRLQTNPSYPLLSPCCGSQSPAPVIWVQLWSAAVSIASAK